MKNHTIKILSQIECVCGKSRQLSLFMSQQAVVSSLHVVSSEPPEMARIESMGILGFPHGRLFYVRYIFLFHALITQFN